MIVNDHINPVLNILKHPMVRHMFSTYILSMPSPIYHHWATQASANFLKKTFGTEDGSGNNVPLTTIDPSDLTGPQLVLLALYLRGGGTFAAASALQCLIADTIVKEVTEDDVASFKTSLNNSTVMDSAVRKNLLHRQGLFAKHLFASAQFWKCIQRTCRQRLWTFVPPKWQPCSDSCQEDMDNSSMWTVLRIHTRFLKCIKESRLWSPLSILALIWCVPSLNWRYFT